MHPLGSGSSFAKEEVELTIGAAKVGSVVDATSSFEAYQLLTAGTPHQRFPQVTPMACC